MRPNLLLSRQNLESEVSADAISCNLRPKWPAFFFKASKVGCFYLVKWITSGSKDIQSWIISRDLVESKSSNVTLDHRHVSCEHFMHDLCFLHWYPASYNRLWACLIGQASNVSHWNQIILKRATVSVHGYHHRGVNLRTTSNWYKQATPPPPPRMRIKFYV